MAYSTGPYTPERANGRNGSLGPAASPIERVSLARMVALAFALTCVTAAPPANPEAALEALQAIGSAMPCRRQDRVIDIPVEKRGPDGPDHAHNFGPADKRPELAGKSAAILPFASHPSRRVVHRAVDLLCAIQDEPSKRKIRELAERYPCSGWLERAVDGADAARKGRKPRPVTEAECEGREEDVGVPGEPASWTRWRTPNAVALAKRIDSGDEASAARALLALEAMDPALIREAAAALSLVSKRVAVARLLRGSSPITAPLEQLLLENLARANHSEKANEVIELVRAYPQLGGEVFSFAAADWPTFLELAHRAQAEARNPAYPMELRLWFERFEDQEPLDDPEDDFKATQEFDRLLQAKNVARLLEIQRDPKNPRRRRLQAGSYLAQLGEAAGMDIFDDPESVASSLAPQVREELEELTKSAQGAARERVLRALTHYPPPDAGTP